MMSDVGSRNWTNTTITNTTSKTSIKYELPSTISSALNSLTIPKPTNPSNYTTMISAHHHSFDTNQTTAHSTMNPSKVLHHNSTTSPTDSSSSLLGGSVASESVFPKMMIGGGQKEQQVNGFVGGLGGSDETSPTSYFLESSFPFPNQTSSSSSSNFDNNNSIEKVGGNDNWTSSSSLASLTTGNHNKNQDDVDNWAFVNNVRLQIVDNNNNNNNTNNTNNSSILSLPLEYILALCGTVFLLVFLFGAMGIWIRRRRNGMIGEEYKGDNDGAWDNLSLNYIDNPNDINIQDSWESISDESFYASLEEAIAAQAKGLPLYNNLNETKT